MNENYEQPKKSGTAMKVVLIIVTIISIVAAAAMGLLYYNATTNLALVREKNEALGIDRDKYKALAAEYEVKIGEYEEEVKDLTAQLAEAQSLVQAPTLAGQDTTSTDDTTTTTPDSTTTTTDTTVPTPTPTPTPEAPKDNSSLDGVTSLDKKPAEDKMLKETVEYKCIVKGLNLRSGPGTNYRQVGAINQDDVVTAYAQDGDWLLIKTSGGIYGWVKSNYVNKK